MTAHIAKHWTKYGFRGYDCFVVGLSTFFAKDMKSAKEWCDSHGFTYIRT